MGVTSPDADIAGIADIGAGRRKTRIRAMSPFSRTTASWTRAGKSAPALARSKISAKLASVTF